MMPRNSKAAEPVTTLENGLDVEKILKKFVEHFTERFGNSTDAFVEENGRKLFLIVYPSINQWHRQLLY